MKELAEKIAFHFLGTPYIWGGDDPTGFDCSGFIIEILQSVGILLPRGDWTADMLWNMFRKEEMEKPAKGCLVFWFNEQGKARHVELCLDDRLSIGASGGGSKCKTAADAYRKNAYVKIRPFEGRGSNIKFVDPFK